VKIDVLHLGGMKKTKLVFHSLPKDIFNTVIQCFL